VSDSPDSTPQSVEAADRRRTTRTTKDRRNVTARMPGVWTDAERARFIARIREARHDALATTIQAGVQVVSRAPGRYASTRRLAQIVRACVLCGATHLGATDDGGIVTVVCLDCGATFQIEYDPPDQPDTHVRIELLGPGHRRCG
jgi:hypothetical protein